MSTTGLPARHIILNGHVRRDHRELWTGARASYPHCNWGAPSRFVRHVAHIVDATARRVRVSRVRPCPYPGRLAPDVP